MVFITVRVACAASATALYLVKLAIGLQTKLPKQALVRLYSLSMHRQQFIHQAIQTGPNILLKLDRAIDSRPAGGNSTVYRGGSLLTILLPVCALRTYQEEGQPAAAVRIVALKCALCSLRIARGVDYPLCRLLCVSH